MKRFAIMLAAVIGWQSVARAADEPRPFVRHVQQDVALSTIPLNLRDGAEASDGAGAKWSLAVVSNPVTGQLDAQDYRLTWTLGAGAVQGVSVGVTFEFKDWSAENFVMVPAAVYDGNRFDIRGGGWPCYWFDPSEWRLDMPTTMNCIYTLGKNPAGSGRISLSTGDASVPLMAWQSSEKKTGWMVQTVQDSRLGNNRLLIEETRGRTAARFEISTPAATWNTGDTITIPFRVYAFPAATRGDLYRRFFTARKDLNPAERKEELPFSAGFALLNDLYQSRRWDEKTGLYWQSDVGAAKSWTDIWQLGWCGGGQVTEALLTQGADQTRSRAMRNLDTIFAQTQTRSGFFNTLGDGVHFASFGYGGALKNHESLIRSQGDWLYMAQRQFDVIKSQGGRIPDAWMTDTKHLAEAFAIVWNKYDQFGQFVDVETGNLNIGGSTSGGIIPGGLALASRTFNDPRYLSIAEEAARKYVKDYVDLGYTTGGPGDILSAPDSESAFGLMESLVTLYEITGDDEWLKDAGELLPICASWTVPYDYHFPRMSLLDQIEARSCGAVFASVQNKHGSPGICTWSGDMLLRYYRATGDRRALDLLTDIAHGITQYISRDDRRIGNLQPGQICERVNLSAWEGEQNVGGNIFGSSAWTETAAMLTFTELPGLYVQPDTGLAVAFDNVRIEDINHTGRTVKFRLTNPTRFPADVRVLEESSRAAKVPAGSFALKRLPIVHLDAGASKTLEYTLPPT